MKMRLLVCFTVFGLAAGSASAALLGTYNFTGNAPGNAGAGSFVAGTSFGAWTRTGTTADTGGTGNNAFSTRGWGDFTVLQTGRYVEFIVAPTGGRTLTLNSFTFDATRENFTSPRNVQIRVFQQSSGTLLGSTASGSFPAFDTSESFTFTLPSAISSGGALAVRLYAWDSFSGTDGRLTIDNVAVNGSISAVPEPVNVALLAFGLGLAGVWTGRRWFNRRALR